MQWKYREKYNVECKADQRFRVILFYVVFIWIQIIMQSNLLSGRADKINQLFISKFLPKYYK